MKVRYNDNAATVLSAHVEPGHTVLIVSSASKFPILTGGDWMYVTVEEEIVKVIETSGNVFTCEPFSSSHGIGATVENRITKEVLDDAQDADVYDTYNDAPANGSMRKAEMFVNMANKQFGVGDESGNPVSLIAVRFHSSTAGYAIDDIVTYLGGLWKCVLVHVGAWDENNWEKVSGSGGATWASSPSGILAAETGFGYFVFTNTESRQVNLPVGTVGDKIIFSDISGNASVNNITFISNGSENFMGLAENFILDIDNASIELVYADSSNGWQIVSGGW